MEHLFCNAGFEKIKTKYILFTTKRLPAALLPLFRLLDIVLERVPLVNTLAGIIMVKAVKN